MGYSKGRSMAVASMVLGIITIASAIFCMVYIPFITGGLAILLATLSRGKDKFFYGKARAGLITALGGIAINIAIIGLVLYAFFCIPGIREQSEALFEQMYGMNMEEVMQQLLSTGM